jgi:Rrf2 family transcriptional regulator, cysteine metabolism repressor
MNLSAKTEYACLAMLELAKEFDSGEPVQLRKIAAEHGIPARFLVQILLQLKGASLVASTRGAAGGYRLARPPQKITLAEVIDVTEGDDRLESNAAKESPLVRTLLGFCREVREVERDRLESESLADLVAAATEREPMYFI